MIKQIVKIILNNMEDVLILSGLACAAAATFQLSFIAGLYVIGVELLGLGIWFTVYPPGRE
ncbi:hypothetical protein FL966_05910 [Caproiciproducens galactitolivorans]|uniref:Uncharacterized protein n=1 Tax=Caproiciproducens galactitolivorans TaxID=642589 RepID=A0A4Z0Y7X6_9FIRM|nr:hypothetical protein [Caproiciproducens galactitolivorans]QEY34624.1 hypothetical protein FL966_05910 [Caproiciproducens galactitolivorans]TGJ75411.1 hypothetical protein CAGA_24350 [Caproiciproducens galactitolivorans]